MPSPERKPPIAQPFAPQLARTEIEAGDLRIDHRDDFRQGRIARKRLKLRTVGLVEVDGVLEEEFSGRIRPRSVETSEGFARNSVASVGFVELFSQNSGASCEGNPVPRTPCH